MSDEGQEIRNHSSLILLILLILSEERICHGAKDDATGVFQSDGAGRGGGDVERFVARNGICEKSRVAE